MKTKNKPMKTCIKNLFLLPALIAGLGLMPAGRATAQTFTNLHSFTAVSGPNYTNSDGANPYAGVILSGNTLYGTANRGGSSTYGTVFAVNTDGTGFTNLYSFTGGNDGSGLVAGLILSGNTLYGTTPYGGTNGYGTVFKVNTNGTGFTNLHSFTGVSDGAYPQAGLILSGNTLYGTASQGGTNSGGAVFKVNTDGIGFTNLHSFTGVSDGANPQAGLILSGNTLYGTVEYYGGTNGNGGGTVFAVNTDGTGFTNLHSFTYGSDGYWPLAGLILSGNTLYGTTPYGGTNGTGTVFAINTNGTGFKTLYSFTAIDPNTGTNSDGFYPAAGLILLGSTLYGTTEYSGTNGMGTIFAINTNGSGFTTLRSEEHTSELQSLRH